MHYLKGSGAHRILPAALAFLLILSLFAGCAASTEPDTADFTNEPSLQTQDGEALQDTAPVVSISESAEQPDNTDGGAAPEEPQEQADSEPASAAEPDGTNTDAAPDDTTPAQSETAEETASLPLSELEPSPDADAPTVDTAPVCTISISCATILDNLDQFDPDKTDLVPSDGWLLEPVTVTFTEGESVFDVLLRVCRDERIHMEYENTPAYQSAYIEGIGNLYEFDCGSLSGWMYRVNGDFPNYGCSKYTLSDGDVIEWVYTCDLGTDVGGGYSTGG